MLMIFISIDTRGDYTLCCVTPGPIYKYENFKYIIFGYLKEHKLTGA